MKILFLTIALLGYTTLSAKDVIYDTTTSLLWQDAKANKELAVTYKEAEDYCSKLVIDKYEDFRLPTLNELQSIIDYNNYKPAILRGFVNAANETYWSSTTFADDNREVWTINFKKGERSVKAKHYDRYVRCVQK